jgi:hypothetical protein
MNASVTSSVPQVALRVLDPSLPLLAAQAAAEIDNAIIALKYGGQSEISLDSLPHLESFLRNFEGFGSRHGQALGMVDPVTQCVVMRAYTDSFKVNPSPAELFSATAALAEGWSATCSSDFIGSKLEPLRDFCVALSNYAASKRLAVFGNRLRHPFSK